MGSIFPCSMRTGCAIFGATVSSNVYKMLWFCGFLVFWFLDVFWFFGWFFGFFGCVSGCFFHGFLVFLGGFLVLWVVFLFFGWFLFLDGFSVFWDGFLDGFLVCWVVNSGFLVFLVFLWFFGWFFCFFLIGVRFFWMAFWMVS